MCVLLLFPDHIENMKFGGIGEDGMKMGICMLMLVMACFSVQPCWGSSQVIYLKPPGTVSLTAMNSGEIFMSAGGINFEALEWEIVDFAPQIYHLKHVSWKFFLEVDLKQAFVFRVTQGEIGSSSREKYLDPRFRLAPAIQEVASILKLKLYFVNPCIVLDWHNKTCSIKQDDELLSSPEAWDFWPATSTICQFRSRHLLALCPKEFYEYDGLHSFTLTKMSGDQFGIRNPEKKGMKLGVEVMKTEIIENSAENLNVGSNRVVIAPGKFPGTQSDKLHQFPVDQGSALVTVARRDTSRVDSNIILPDIAIEQQGKKNELSRWQESDRILYLDVLKSSKFDILIVPFQVSGYAFDRNARALMTQYLSQRIRKATRLKISDPTLVAKALGEVRRTYNAETVYALANALNVRKIIWCYAGHEQDMEMNLHFAVQERNRKALIGENTPKKIVERQDIPFDDLVIPSMAFQSVLDGLAEELGFPLAAEPVTAVKVTQTDPVLPSTLTNLVENAEPIAATGATSLQLIASLHPLRTEERENLYERSLVLLENVSPESPWYRLLKSRALFHLGRRPAAVEVLKNCRTPHEMSFLEYLNGNLGAARLQAENIKSPIFRVLAEIELAELAKTYDVNESFIQRIPESVLRLPQWKDLIEWRINRLDPMHVDDNVQVKQWLDMFFPLEGFSLKDLVYRTMVVGREADTEAFDTSPFLHVRKYIGINKLTSQEDGSSGPVSRDLLILFDAIAQANLIQRVDFLFLRASTESISAEFNKFKPFFDGHPWLELRRVQLLKRIAWQSQGAARANLEKDIQNLSEEISSWEQGQTLLSWKSGYSKEYDYDFPRRSYWIFGSAANSPSDRKFVDNQGLVLNGDYRVSPVDRRYLWDRRITLEYTQTGFDIFQHYYQALEKWNYTLDAADVLSRFRERFQGHPAREAFLATLESKAGNTSTAMEIYQNSINEHPTVWQPFEKLFLEKIKLGDIIGASQVVMNYPPFSMTELERKRHKINTVDLSNHAFRIGSFYWNFGWCEEGKPFFSLASQFNNGSGAEMESNEMLALDSGDYISSARFSLQAGGTYNYAGGYASYMRYLQVLGEGKAAWAVYETLKNVPNGRKYVSPIILSHQMEGASKEQQLEWFFSQDVENYNNNTALLHSFRMLAVDRPVDMGLVQDFKRIESWIVGKLRAAPYVLTASSEKIISMIPGDPKMFPQGVLSACATLSKSYSLVRSKQFDKAFEEIEKAFLVVPARQTDYSFMIPYGAWAASQSGKSDVMNAFLEKQGQAAGIDFDYYLAKAFLLGEKGDHLAAIEKLNLAWFNRFTAKGERLIPSGYQYLETCEWLYQSTHRIEYRTLLLEKAKAIQRSSPTVAWAYSMQSKYTDSAEDRLKSTAIALYLDSQSMHIADISKKDKQKAYVWLEANNPFLKNLKMEEAEDTRHL